MHTKQETTGLQSSCDGSALLLRSANTLTLPCVQANHMPSLTTPGLR